MDNVKGDSHFIGKALRDIEAILVYTQDIASYAEFMDNDLLIDAVMFRLVQLIENMKNISPEFKASHAEIPWGDIIGFRNGIVHEYGKTDYHEVYNIVKRDILVLKDQFEKA